MNDPRKGESTTGLDESINRRDRTFIAGSNHVASLESSHLAAHTEFSVRAAQVQSAEELYRLSSSFLSPLLGVSEARIVFLTDGDDCDHCSFVVLSEDCSVSYEEYSELPPESAVKLAMQERRLVTTLEFSRDMFFEWDQAGQISELEQFITCPLNTKISHSGAVWLGYPAQRSLGETDLLRVHLFVQVLSTHLDMLTLSSDLLASQDALESTQSKLVEQEKIMTLSNLVAGLAHEVNTPLGVALTALSVAQERAIEVQEMLNTQSVSRRHLTTCIHEVSQGTSLAFTNLSHAAELVKDFKMFSTEHRVGHVKYLDVLKLCHNVGESLNPLLKKHRVKLNVTGSEVRLRTDSDILRSALINLIQNACVHGYGPWDPMSQSPHINRVIDVQVSSWVDQGQRGVQISVIDFGVGIPQELHERIFESFYTTARGRGGTGLGLHLVYSAIQGVLGGQLKLKSELGRGASFILMLPTLDRAPESHVEERD